MMHNRETTLIARDESNSFVDSACKLSVSEGILEPKPIRLSGEIDVR